MAKKPAIQPTDSTTAEMPDKRQMLLEGQELEALEPETAESQTGTEVPTDETVVPEATEQADTTESTEEATESTILQRMQEMGLKFDDESQAFDTLLNSYQGLMQQQQTYQQRMQELEELAQVGNDFLRSQREVKPEAAPEHQGPEPWWNPPKFDPKWIEQYRDVTVGQDGQPVLGWKKNTPREVQESADKYQQYLEQWATDLVQRPQEVLPKIVEQEFDRLFEERIQRRDEEARLSTFAERVRDSNRDWMYTTDSQGRERLTAAGQMMTEILSEVAESGVTDPESQWRYAVAMYDYRNRSQQVAATEQTTQVKQAAAETRRKQLQRGTTQPVHNRSGSVPRPEEESPLSQNSHLTPGEQLLQQLRDDGANFV